MTIINPADDVEAKSAVEAAILHNGPVYLRSADLQLRFLMIRKHINLKWEKVLL